MSEPYVGEIKVLAGGEIPPGWAACDGQVLAIKEHSSLYKVLGSAYGGNGKTTFALPDLRGRVAMHSSPATPAGTAGGENQHALSAAELPAHAHGSLGMIAQVDSRSLNAHHGAASAISTVREVTSMQVAASVPATATGEPHDNMQPYIALTFVIALDGASPARK
jgi:microcystin-dependent protein